MKRRPPRSTLFPYRLSSVLDVLLLTALLYFTGGPFNPFSFFYLVEIALGAAVLRPRWIWALVVLSLACSGLLFLDYRELPIDRKSTRLNSSHSQDRMPSSAC